MTLHIGLLIILHYLGIRYLQQWVMLVCFLLVVTRNAAETSGMCW